MKKIGKRILCGVIAVVILLSASIPVLADELSNSVVRKAVSYYGYYKNGEEVVKNKLYTYSYQADYNNFYPFILNYGDSIILSAVTDTPDYKNWSISSSEEQIVEPKWKNEGSQKLGNSVLALDYFKNNVMTFNNNRISFYDYLVSCGCSSEELDNNLSKTYIAPAFSLGVDFNDANREACFSCQKLDILGLYNYVKKMNVEDFKPWDSSGTDDSGSGSEPPKFYLKTYNAYGMNKFSEYTLTWDTKGSFVEGKESDYGFKVYIAKENKPSDAKVLESTELSPCLFSANSLVFTWQDVKDLFSFLSTSKLENRFDVFVQITDKSGKAVSDNYIHFLVVKRMEIRDSNYVDKDGNEQKSYGKWENGQFEYTDGRETSADDKTTNSNGSSTAPSSNVKNDGYTNAENAPSSSNFDASATKSLIKTLDTIVTTLGDVPALLANVYSWLPVEIITLIGTGIGLIVVVGIAKWLL